MKNNFSYIDSVMIAQTVKVLQNRIEERFPDSGLSRVCAQLTDIAEQAEERSIKISKPIYALRYSIWFLIAFCVIGTIWGIVHLNLPATVQSLPDLVQTLESGTNEIIIVVAGIIFLMSIETRMQRRYALKAIHELRSIAHMIDIHQLPKDPERLYRKSGDTKSSPKQTIDNAFELERYLDYCSEMLSFTGKIAVIYVQRFDDNISLMSANEVENLANALSGKLWQKITILQGMKDRHSEEE